METITLTYEDTLSIMNAQSVRLVNCLSFCVARGSVTMVEMLRMFFEHQAIEVLEGGERVLFSFKDDLEAVEFRLRKL